MDRTGHGEGDERVPEHDPADLDCQPASAAPHQDIQALERSGFAPKQYAVFNGNTAEALRAVGAAPPKTLTLFSPEAYARVCSVVEAVRRRIGGEDLSDTDAFLNWIYQTKVKRLAEK